MVGGGGNLIVEVKERMVRMGAVGECIGSGQGGRGALRSCMGGV